MALGSVFLIMINTTVTTKRRTSCYWWGMCAVWFSGLVVVGYGACPRSDVATSLLRVESADASAPSIITKPTQCWQPLAEYTAVTPSSRSVDAVRGSLISQGQRFILRQDASGHLYRWPVSDGSKTYNDKRTGFGSTANTVHDTGNPNDAMRLHGMVDRLSDIQRCDGHGAPRGGGESPL